MVDRADTFPQRNQIMLLSAACRIAEGGEIRACLVVRACNDHHVLRARLVGDERAVGWVGLGFLTGRDHDDDALRSEEPTSEIQSLLRRPHAVSCLQNKHHPSTPSSPNATQTRTTS